MSDLLDRARNGRNWIETIADRVPGFSGYQEREMRRETDRLFREHLGRKVDSLRTRLQGAIRDLSRSGNLDALTGVDRVEKGLDSLGQRVRVAEAGYAGFFDALKVGVAELDELYRFDLAFDDVIAGLEPLVEAFSNGPDRDPAPLGRAVDEALTTWAGRRELFLRVAGGHRG